MRVAYYYLVCLRRKISMHYFSYSGGPSAELTKAASGHGTLNLCFCIRCDLWVAYYVLVHPGRGTMTHYFSCSGGPGVNRIKSAPGPLH
jgi:hypothetical protein